MDWSTELAEMEWSLVAPRSLVVHRHWDRFLLDAHRWKQRAHRRADRFFRSRSTAFWLWPRGHRR